MSDLWVPSAVPLDGAIELARTQRQKVSVAKLLDPHKIQLLAMERAASGEGQAAVTRATGIPAKNLAARQAIRSGHLLSAAMASRHLKQEFAALGVPFPAGVKTVGYDYADQLHRDLLPALANTTLTEDEKQRRVAIAVVSAVNRAYTDQQLATYAAATAANDPHRLRKQWATNKLARTAPCKHCTWLDGKIVDLDDEFPLPPGIRAVYGGHLIGPPLHPNCRCRLIPRLAVV